MAALTTLFEVLLRHASGKVEKGDENFSQNGRLWAEITSHTQTGMILT
jgi:hypothetical protein